MTVAPVLPGAAAAATILGGVAWAALAVPAQLVYADIISYDSYNRLLALPIALVLVGFVGLYRRLSARSGLAKAGLAALVFGFLLLLIGNLVEFWGALIFDEDTAEAARDAGSGEHWIGSDIGWIVFGVGMLLSIPAAVAVAVSVRSVALPAAVKLFIGFIGVGVLATNLFGLSPFYVSIPVFLVYGAGWIALGASMRRDLRATPSAFGTGSSDE